MACNRCGHTKSSPCACKDHGLTTPCSFTNCTTTTCDEVFCYECVIDCYKFPELRLNKTWAAEDTTGTISNPNDEFYVSKADNMLTMLQRLALRVTDPAGAQTSAQLAIAPVFVDTVLSTSLKINWSNTPSTVTSISIYQAPAQGTTYTLVTTLSTNLAITTSYTLTNLTPSTGYKYKLISTGLLTTGVSASANSAVVYVQTPAT